MKKLTLIAFVCAALISISACTTTKPAVPAGCEESPIYAAAPYSFIAMSGLRIVASEVLNAEEYARLREVAKTVAVLLQDETVTIERLQGVPGWSKVLIADLSAWYRPGQVISKCDRDLLIGYLQRF